MQCEIKGCILFDWGDTLMRDFKQFSGPMKDWPRVEAIPGASETLAALHPAWLLALATSADVSDEKDIRVALQRVFLDQWLDRIYCFKNIGYKKPSLEFYRTIQADLRLPPHSICMLGDNFEADVLAANRSGMRAIWFNEHSLEDRHGDLHRTIHILGALPDSLKGFLF